MYLYSSVKVSGPKKLSEISQVTVYKALSEVSSVRFVRTKSQVWNFIKNYEVELVSCSSEERQTLQLGACTWRKTRKENNVQSGIIVGRAIKRIAWCPRRSTPAGEKTTTLPPESTRRLLPRNEHADRLLRAREFAVSFRAPFSVYASSRMSSVFLPRNTRRSLVVAFRQRYATRSTGGPICLYNVSMFRDHTWFSTYLWLLEREWYLASTDVCLERRSYTKDIRTIKKLQTSVLTLKLVLKFILLWKCSSLSRSKWVLFFSKMLRYVKTYNVRNRFQDNDRWKPDVWCFFFFQISGENMTEYNEDNVTIFWIFDQA